MIVLDASAVLELLLGGLAAERIARRLAPETESLHAPHLLDLEVAQIVRRYHRAGLLDEARGRDVLRDLGELDVSAVSPRRLPAAGSCATSLRSTTRPTSRWPRSCQHLSSRSTGGSLARADTAREWSS